MRTTTTIIIAFLWWTNGFSQIDSFPEKLLTDDALTILIKRVGCHVSNSKRIYIRQLNDTVLMVNYFSPHVESYFFEKNDVFKYHKTETREFLKDNKLVLNKHYNADIKPINSLKGFSQGLTQIRLMNDKLDSTLYLSSKSFEKIRQFYLSVKSGEFNTKKINGGDIIAGDYTYFDIYLTRMGKTLELIKEKGIRGWYDLLLTSEKYK